MSAAKKKTITCPKCGKEYSSRNRECPQCNRGQYEDAKRRQKTAPDTTGGEELGVLTNGSEEDLAKWLMGEKKDFAGWMEEGAIADDAPEPAEIGTIDDSSKVIEAWLRGDVGDLTSWLSGDEIQAQPPPSDEVELSEGASAELERSSRELAKLIEGYRAGKTPYEEIANAASSVLSDIQVLRIENRQLRGELEGVRKGSTALAKYFKSVQGKEEVEADQFADRLAAEMAAREELELQNLRLNSALETYKEQLESRIEELPVDQQEMKKLQIQIEEKERTLNEMERHLKEREKQLAEAETEERAELRGKFSAELQERITEFEKTEGGLKADLERMKFKTRELEVELQHKNEQLELLYQKTEGGEVSESLKSRLADLQRVERELAMRSEEVAVLRDKLAMKEEEVTKIKEPMRYKEDELLRREEDLLHREKVLQEEIRRLEHAKAELGSQDELELKKRLEQLQAEITAKEEEIKSKEKYLSSKAEELRLREQSVIGEEIERREEERALEFSIEKVKTGTTRLDDLLMGGLPFGTNVLVYGPPFMGKETLVNSFVAEGLKKGVPAIWVTTERTPAEIRSEMQFIISGFEEYEKLGLVKFIDPYSRSMGETTEEPNVYYVEAPTDFNDIQKGVEAATKELMENHKYYRFVFRSISTMIAYLDPATAFRFLNPIVGRRKRDKAVGMFLIEKGMHGDQEIQMVGSLMDGMIEFKVENLNTFLSVRGIGEVQSRAWIRYTTTKSGVNIGSFALDHIR